MQQLFTIGEHPSGSLLIQDGIVEVSLAEDEKFTIEATGALVGAEEELLDLSSERCLGRLYSATLVRGTVEKACSKEETRALLELFEYGFIQNRFTSQLLAQATQISSRRRIVATEEDKQHEALALAFASLLVQVKRYAERKQLKDVLAVVAQAAPLPLFELGVRLRRERVGPALKFQMGSADKKASRIPARSMLCQEGDQAQGMYVLLEGKIAVVQQGRVVARIEESGEAFGEMALFLEGRRTATLVAEVDSAVYHIREKDMPDFHRAHPDVFFNIGATLAQRLQSTLQVLSALRDGRKGRRYSDEQVAEAKKLYAEIRERLTLFRTVPRDPELEEILEANRSVPE